MFFDKLYINLSKFVKSSNCVQIPLQVRLCDIYILWRKGLMIKPTNWFYLLNPSDFSGKDLFTKGLFGRKYYASLIRWHGPVGEAILSSKYYTLTICVIIRCRLCSINVFWVKNMCVVFFKLVKRSCFFPPQTNGAPFTNHVRDKRFPF